MLLVGDACQDYKDNYHTGSVNYVPTQIVETGILGETPSDNWFVTVSGPDIIPDMFIGRLSAQSSRQVDDIVNKIIAYEQSPPAPDWNRAVLLVADDDLSGFEATSETLAGLLPPDFMVFRVYAEAYPPGIPSVDVVDGLNAGMALVNYSGHGSVDTWGVWEDDYILDLEDIEALNNVDRLPVVTVADCLNGFFSGPHSQIAVAEALQRRQAGGAAAVWAPTGLNYPAGHEALLSAFYEAVFQQRQLALGQATTTAKLAIAGQNPVWDELVETFVLFGDPAMALGIPSGNIGDPARSVFLPVISKNH